MTEWSTSALKLKAERLYFNMLVNGLKGVDLRTGLRVEIALNYKEMQLVLDQSETVNESWELMCDAVLERTGRQIKGAMDLDYIVVNGVEKVFH